MGSLQFIAVFLPCAVLVVSEVIFLHRVSWHQDKIQQEAALIQYYTCAVSTKVTLRYTKYCDSTD